MTDNKKTVLFAFRGDPMCFIHVLLNAIDLHGRGLEGKIILEGEAVSLVAPMSEPGHFLSAPYEKAKSLDLFLGACKACSAKLGATGAIQAQGIPLIGDMSGHPAMGPFIQEGYAVITF